MYRSVIPFPYPEVQKDILSPTPNTFRKTEPPKSWDGTSLEIYKEREEERPLQQWWKDFQLKREERHVSQLLFCGTFLHPSDQDGRSWAGVGSEHTETFLTVLVQPVQPREEKLQMTAASKQTWLNAVFAHTSQLCWDATSTTFYFICSLMPTITPIEESNVL